MKRIKIVDGPHAGEWYEVEDYIPMIELPEKFDELLGLGDSVPDTSTFKAYLYRIEGPNAYLVT